MVVPALRFAELLGVDLLQRERARARATDAPAEHFVVFVYVSTHGIRGVVVTRQAGIIDPPRPVAGEHVPLPLSSAQRHCEASLRSNSAILLRPAGIYHLPAHHRVGTAGEHGNEAISIDSGQESTPHSPARPSHWIAPLRGLDGT